MRVSWARAARRRGSGAARRGRSESAGAVVSVAIWPPTMTSCRSASEVATPRFCSISRMRSPSSSSVLNDLDQVLDDRRREPLGGLVHDQQLRVRQERAADREHLLLAAGELRAAVLLALGEAREELVDRGRRPARRRAAARRIMRRCSSTESDGNSRRPCGHVADPEPGDLVRAACRRAPCPRTRIEPRDPRRRMPMIALQSVVLPMPFRPTIATDSRPSRTRRPGGCAPSRSRRSGPRARAAAQSLVPVARCRGRGRARAGSRGSRRASPRRSTRPSCIIVTCSATRSATSMSCSIRISVIVAVEREQQVGEQRPLAAREPRGGLVEHHQPGLGGERHARARAAGARRARASRRARRACRRSRRDAAAARARSRMLARRGLRAQTGRSRPPSTPTIAR